MRNLMTPIRHPSPIKTSWPSLQTFSSLQQPISKPPSSIQNFTNGHLHHITHREADQTHNHTVTVFSPTPTAPHFSHPSRRWMPFLVPRPTRYMTLHTVHRLPPLTRTARSTPPLCLKQRGHYPVCPLSTPSHVRPSARSRTSFVIMAMTGKSTATPPVSRRLHLQRKHFPACHTL